MISLYSGTPGSGKSLHTATRIYYHLRFGKPVIANFPINTRKVRKKPGLLFYYWPNDGLTPDDLIKFSRWYFKGKPVKEDTILLVIDECQLMFNSREWQKSGRAEWLSFFTQHRKYGFAIILVAQFDRMVDRQIRSLIEYEYKHRKVSNFGIQGKLLSLASCGSLFVAVKMWYPLGEKVGSDFFHAKKKYYSLYDTYADFGVGDAQANVAAEQLKKV